MSIEPKKRPHLTTYDVGNPGPDMRQAHKCDDLEFHLKSFIAHKKTTTHVFMYPSSAKTDHHHQNVTGCL